MNAIGACGLQLYNFGQTVSLVFFTDSWKPDSFYDRVKENADLGTHTLVLLDIKVKEQSEENLARCTIPRPFLSYRGRTDTHYVPSICRGRNIYEPPRYMSIPLAVSQLLEVESTRQSGILSPETTLAIAVSRVGGGEHQRIVCGTLQELSEQADEVYGEPLHSLVIVGKRLHHLEAQYAETYAVNKDNWIAVAKNVYQCNFD